MECSPVKTIRRSRKVYTCHWCAERVEIHSTYSTWFTYGENTITRMHPECYTAMLKADHYDEELPPPGTYRRGCWCGEREEHCTCIAKARQAGEGEA